MTKLQNELEALSAVEAAKRLLGCELLRSTPEGNIRVRIIETEAYDETDEASHSHRGKTPRNEVMFGPSGHLYVYFTYGMHFCCNVVVGPAGVAAAVLIRSVEPLSGRGVMEHYRRAPNPASLSNGPAKVCQALAIDTSLNGHDLNNDPCTLLLKPAPKNDRVISTPRIGISRAVEKPWRFVLSNQ